MPDPLVAFLVARLAEDEEKAKHQLVARPWGRRRAALTLVQRTADRRVLELHSGANDRCRTEGPCEPLREMARRYSRHPEFREEWR